MVESVDFAFMFANFCHFYNYRHDETLAMPAMLFWDMNSQIARIQAKDDLRELSVLKPNTEEGVQKIVEHLRAQLGDEYRADHTHAPRDTDAGAKLRALSG